MERPCHFDHHSGNISNWSFNRPFNRQSVWMNSSDSLEGAFPFTIHYLIRSMKKNELRRFKQTSLSWSPWIDHEKTTKYEIIFVSFHSWSLKHHNYEIALLNKWVHYVISMMYRNKDSIMNAKMWPNWFIAGKRKNYRPSTILSVRSTAANTQLAFCWVCDCRLLLSSIFIVHKFLSNLKLWFWIEDDHNRCRKLKWMEV